MVTEYWGRLYFLRVVFLDCIHNLSYNDIDCEWLDDELDDGLDCGLDCGLDDGLDDVWTNEHWVCLGVYCWVDGFPDVQGSWCEVWEMEEESGEVCFLFFGYKVKTGLGLSELIVSVNVPVSAS